MKQVRTMTLERLRNNPTVTLDDVNKRVYVIGFRDYHGIYKMAGQLVEPHRGESYSDEVELTESLFTLKHYLEEFLC